VRALDALGKLNDVSAARPRFGLKDRLVENFTIDMRFPLPPECGLHGLEYGVDGAAFRWTGARRGRVHAALRRDEDLLADLDVPFAARRGHGDLVCHSTWGCGADA